MGRSPRTDECHRLEFFDLSLGDLLGLELFGPGTSRSYRVVEVRDAWRNGSLFQFYPAFDYAGAEWERVARDEDEGLALG